MHQAIFNLLLILLPTQLGLHFWPPWALVLGRRVDFLSPTLYGTDVLIVLILVFWHPKKTPYSFFIIPALAAANIYFAGNRFVSMYFWVKALEFLLLGFYIVKTKQKFSSLIFFLSIGVLYSSLIAIAQFILQRSVGGPLWFLGERTLAVDTPGIARFFYQQMTLRAYATFPHPNVLGGFLAIMVPVMAGEFPRKKIFYSAALTVGVLALVLTFSRSAWIAMLLGVSMMLFKKNKKLLFPAVVGVLLITFFILKTFGFQDESFVVRRELNNSAIVMFRESPIIGKGLGNFLVELPKHLVSRQIYFLQPVHNIFLLVLSETGIIGCALFFYVLWRAKKKWILIPILFLGFVDHYFLTLQQGQLLLTILLSSTIAL